MNIAKMADQEKEERDNELVNDCLDDLKKFYGRPHQRNTPVNLGRRGESLAANILLQYSPHILQLAFDLLPLVLHQDRNERVRRIT